MCLTAVFAHRVPQVVRACAAAGPRIGVAAHQLPVATLSAAHLRDPEAQLLVSAALDRRRRTLVADKEARFVTWSASVRFTGVRRT
jgi:hypothetical protein